MDRNRCCFPEILNAIGAQNSRRAQPVSVNFLKVAHHGSKTSTTEPFLAAAHPLFAAISVGRDNSFGHPSPEVTERLEAAGVHVYRTDRDGAITATPTEIA